MAIEFDATAQPPGLEVHDTIEQRHLYVKSDAPVSPRPVETPEFAFPIDRACVVETSSLVFDNQYFVSVHDADGRCVQSLETGDRRYLDGDEYCLGLNGPVQLYCRVPGRGNIEARVNSARLTFDRETTVTIGARSHHDRPAGTIRTPTDVDSMMRAVSALSSALKTVSPERAWPSLRGHPPVIERGDALEIPDGIAPPDTGVTLTIPPTYRHLYAVAPLSFYLGATVASGSQAALETPSLRRPLGADRRVETDVARLLQQCFLLDCLVRTEGLFRNDLYERDRLEDAVPFDLAATYELSPAARLERYLEVPYEVLEDYVPRWPLTAHVPATPESVALLPYVVNELGIVRRPRGDVVDAATHLPEREAGFVRSTRSALDRASDASSDSRRFVVPDVTDESIEHAWFDDHVPRGASKATLEAYRAQLAREARSESIEILLVCNDARMLDEHDALDDAYGSREHLPFDVRSEFGVDSDRLGSLLADEGCNFLHFIGHASPGGLHCSDGKLDVRSLDSVDVDVFFLNACRSYEQGLALTRRGSFGGVSTLSDVVNAAAIDIGELTARLLNLGFPLRAAVEIVRANAHLGEQYLIVGDGSADIAQSNGGAPLITDIEPAADDQYEFAVRSYSTTEYQLGTTTSSTLESAPDRHLTPGTSPSSRVSTEALEEYLTWTGVPAMIDGDLRFTDDFGPVSLD